MKGEEKKKNQNILFPPTRRGRREKEKGEGKAKTGNV